MICNDFVYAKEKVRKNTTHWVCLLYKSSVKCKARASTENANPKVVRLTYKEHNHDLNAYTKCRLDRNKDFIKQEEDFFKLVEEVGENFEECVEEVEFVDDDNITLDMVVECGDENVMN